MADTTKNFKNYLVPEFIVVCNDTIIGQDNTLSIVRLVDEYVALAFPLILARFIIVVQFARKKEMSTEELLSANVLHKLVFVNPRGETMEYGPFSLATIDPRAPWLSTRTLLDLSGSMALKEEGDYYIKLMGRVGDAPWEELLEKRMPAKLSGGIPGFYSVEFGVAKLTDESETREAGGYMLLLPDGRIQGGEQGYGYNGSYMVGPNGQMKAIVRIQKGDPAVLPAFGDSEQIDIAFEGVGLPVGRFSLTGARQDGVIQKVTMNLTRQKTMPGPATASI